MNRSMEEVFKEVSKAKYPPKTSRNQPPSIEDTRKLTPRQEKLQAPYKRFFKPLKENIHERRTRFRDHEESTLAPINLDRVCHYDE